MNVLMKLYNNMNKNFMIYRNKKIGLILFTVLLNYFYQLKFIYCKSVTNNIIFMDFVLDGVRLL